MRSPSLWILAIDMAGVEALAARHRALRPDHLDPDRQPTPSPPPTPSPTASARPSTKSTAEQVRTNLAQLGSY
jgi:hypothetical protein